MNTNFLIQNAPPIEGVAATVYATGYRGPLEYLTELESTLATRGVSGTVLIDSLVAHGNRYNRYHTIEFEGLKFKGVCTRADFAYDALAAESASFLAANFEHLDLALLSTALRFAVRNGLPV